MVEYFVYDVTSLQCLSNLRSLSISQNKYFLPIWEESLCYDGVAILNSVSHVHFARFSYLMAFEPLTYGLCSSISDKSMDDYFIDESIVDSFASNCSWQIRDNTTNIQKEVLIKCTRVIEADHVNINFGLIASIIDDDIISNLDNRIEVIDFSHAVLVPNGLRYSNGALRGLKKLRRANSSYLNIKFIHNYAFTDTENMEHLSLSGNTLGVEMNANNLSMMFNKPVYMKILNLSSCSITELKGISCGNFPTYNILICLTTNCQI